jgi:hypothetical protein
VCQCSQQHMWHCTQHLAALGWGKHRLPGLVLGWGLSVHSAQCGSIMIPDTASRSSSNNRVLAQHHCMYIIQQCNAMDVCAKHCIMGQTGAQIHLCWPLL